MERKETDLEKMKRQLNASNGPDGKTKKSNTTNAPSRGPIGDEGGPGMPDYTKKND